MSWLDVFKMEKGKDACLPTRQLSSKAKPYHLYCCWRHPNDTCTGDKRNAELTQCFLSIFLSFSVWESHPRHHTPPPFLPAISCSNIYWRHLRRSPISDFLRSIISLSLDRLWRVKEWWRDIYTAYIEGGIFGFFFFYVRSSTLLHLPPLRFHSVGGCWDRNQDCLALAGRR